MAVPLFIAAAAASTAVASVIGWRARGTVDQITGEVNTAQGTVSTVQLLLILGLLYGSYRFVKGFR